MKPPAYSRQFQYPKKVLPFNDPTTGVNSHDVIISADPEISARIFLPRITNPNRKLPILFYVHGGGCADTAFSLHYHRHVSTLCAEAHAIGVSVEYRLAEREHTTIVNYEDTWATLQWVAAHVKRAGPDTWLNDHADFSHMFLGGDSAGGNITHTVASRAGLEGIPVGIRISGIFMVHPYFGGIEEDDNMWLYVCQPKLGRLDPRLNPPSRDLARIPCCRMLIMVAGEDPLNGTGRCYYWNLKKSGWKGTVELEECQGEEHCFHLQKRNSENAVKLVKKLVLFIKQGCIESSL